MVGHYWLRAPELAPDAKIADDVKAAVEAIAGFAAQVHAGQVKGSAGKFTDLLCIGIGGSALGPQFVADALGGKADKLRVHFIDNTDPDGIDRIFDGLGGRLGTTLAIVTSKSGSTPEPRNGQLEAALRWKQAGLAFAAHAVAVTGEGSQLDQVAVAEKWLARFPMWDWVGGRTSEIGPVGLLPAALQGLDIRGLLAGAREMDVLTRVPDAARNPAAAMALAWHHLTEGRGSKAMGAPLQGPTAAVLPLPPATRHGVARQGARPPRPPGLPRTDRLRQQGIDRPARLRAAAPRWCE